MSQRARDRVDKSIGIHLDPDICRNTDLTLAERIVLAQIRQMDKKGKSGRVVISNAFLAEACGLSESKVDHAVPTLVKKGWLGVEEVGYRVLLIDWATVNPAPETVENPAAKKTQVAAKKTAGTAKKAATTANFAAPSEQEVDVTLNMTDTDAVSVIIEKNRDTPREQAGGSECESPATATACQDAFRDWAPQACSLVHARYWEKRKPDGNTDKVKLEVPVTGRSRPADLATLSGIATARWPGSDPVMAFRQALRAAAWTSDSRDILQQRACGFGDGTISARTVLAIGGKGDLQAFIRERCEAVPEPPTPAPAVEVSDANAEALIAACEGRGRRWDMPCWRKCWQEGAGRALALPECPTGNIQLYAFCALDKADTLPDSVPFPWVVDSVTAADIEAFLPRYLADRESAWRGGPARPYRDQSFLPRNYERCLGWRMAVAASINIELDPEGKHPTQIRSRSCLLCAALDLELNAGLVKYVKRWSGTGMELAIAMRKLAQRTPDDEAPIRSFSCGPERGNNECELVPSSWVRCAYGDAEGVYSQVQEGIFKPCGVTVAPRTDG